MMTFCHGYEDGCPPGTALDQDHTPDTRTWTDLVLRTDGYRKQILPRTQEGQGTGIHGHTGELSGQQAPIQGQLGTDAQGLPTQA